MIHKYRMNDFNIVIDTNSGAVHVLDAIAYDMLDFIDDSMNSNISKDILLSLKSKYNENDIRESYNELYELYKNGELFSSGLEYDDLGKTAFEKSPIKAMCLNIAHDCNLRCEYCFAAKGNFGGEAMLMTLDVGKKAIDFIIERSGNRRNLEVDFFGGEPLMNFGVVKEIVKYAREKEKIHNKNFRFTITTNGLLLNDDIIDFINKEMSNCVLSLDGRKEVNDRLRVRVDGSGSYDSIVSKYKKLVNNRSKDKDYYIRGTFTKYNLDFLKDVMHIADLGFDQVSVEPVISDPKLSYSIKEDDIEVVFDEYEKLANELILRKQEGRGINFFHFMIDLEQGPCAIKRLRGCGAGNEYVAVTPNGEIYPCHQFVGNDKYKMGNLDDDRFDDNMKKYFSKSNIFNKKDCKNCWAKFYCSGGCNANNLTYEGDIFKSHHLSCKLFKKRLECAIAIKVALLLETSAL